MEKRSFNLSAVLGVLGTVSGARFGWKGMEYRNTLQRLANVGRGASRGLFAGLDLAERSLGPYASRIIAGQARRISSDPTRSNLVRGVARKVGMGRANLANKFQSFVNPTNPKGFADYGRKSMYQLAQAVVPGADAIGAMLHRTSPSDRRMVSHIFNAPKPDYTGNLNRLGNKINNMANKYIQGISAY